MKERKEGDQWWCKVKDEESKKVAGEAPETKNKEGLTVGKESKEKRMRKMERVKSERRRMLVYWLD